uniref:ribosomal protein L21 n=1 Tax=Neustupella aerophytica TaxID=2962111 RepID=UPI002182548C|nr:ribosomal protein L21 [Neustupella aerophytica]UVI61112.1 ribosomal protein L21 [Neustupella aerophytica]
MATIYSIIESFGRQFWVEPRKVQDFSSFKLKNKSTPNQIKSFRADHQHTPEKATSVIFDRVMFFTDGNNVQLGRPFLNNYRIEGSLLPGVHKKSKLLVFKMRSKKKYRRKIGHRVSSRRIRFNYILQIVPSKNNSNLQVLVRG